MNTPRTDAEEERTDTPTGLTGVVSADFARELERELNAMTAERDRLAECLKVAEEALEYIKRTCVGFPMIHADDAIAKLRALKGPKP